jgi:hypothetical protein
MGKGFGLEANGKQENNLQPVASSKSPSSNGNNSKLGSTWEDLKGKSV